MSKELRKVEEFLRQQTIKQMSRSIYSSGFDGTVIIPLHEYEKLKNDSAIYNNLIKNKHVFILNDDYCQPEYRIITKSEAIKTLHESLEKDKLEYRYNFEKRLRESSEKYDQKINAMQGTIAGLKAHISKKAIELIERKDTRTLWQRILNR